MRERARGTLHAAHPGDDTTSGRRNDRTPRSADLSRSPRVAGTGLAASRELASSADERAGQHRPLRVAQVGDPAPAAPSRLPDSHSMDLPVDARRELAFRPHVSWSPSSGARASGSGGRTGCGTCWDDESRWRSNPPRHRPAARPGRATSPTLGRRGRSSACRERGCLRDVGDSSANLPSRIRRRSCRGTRCRDCCD